MFIKKSLKHITKNYSVITIIIAFLLLSIYKIDYPGYYYDEVLYAPSMFNACAQNSFNYFVIKFGNFCLPVLVMPYIGALKTYLLLPFVGLGIANNYLVFRGLGILLATLSIFIFYIILKQLKIKNWIIIVCTSLLALNPSFIFANKYDFGPVSIAIFIKSIFLLVLLKFIKNYSFKYLILLGTLSIIGTFNKVDFAFFVLPFMLLTLVNRDFRIKIFEIAKKYKKIFFVFFLIVTLAIIYASTFVLPKLLDFLTSNFTSSTNIFSATTTYINVLNGSAITQVITGLNIAILPFYFLLLISIFAAYTVYLVVAKKFNLEQLSILIALSFYVFIVLFFPKSGGPHHIISMLPTPIMVMAIIFNKIKSKYGKYFLIINTVVILTIYFLVYLNSIILFQKNNVNPSWDKSFEKLTEKLQNNYSDKIVYTTDWGIANQLIMYSKYKLNVIEPFRPISKLSNKEHLQKIRDTDTKNSVALKFKKGVLEEAVKNFPFYNYTYKTNLEIFEFYYSVDPQKQLK